MLGRGLLVRGLDRDAAPDAPPRDHGLRVGLAARQHVRLLLPRALPLLGADHQRLGRPRGAARRHPRAGLQAARAARHHHHPRGDRGRGALLRGAAHGHDARHRDRLRAPEDDRNHALRRARRPPAVRPAGPVRARAGRASVGAEEVAGVDLAGHVGEVVGHAVGHDHVGLALEGVRVADHARAEELLRLHRGLVDDDLDALGLDALHHALDRAVAEVVGSRLHHEPPDPHHPGLALEDGGRDEVLAGGVGLHDGADQVLRHLGVVREELLGVLGQAVAAVAEGGVVVVPADARVEADAADDLARVEAVDLGVGVELVEVGHAHGEVGVGEELDRLGLGRIAQQRRDLLLGRDCALGEEVGEDPAALRAVAHHDARRVEVVLERAPLAQELGRVEHGAPAEPLVEPTRVAHGDGGLDHDRGRGRDAAHVGHHGLDRAGVEVVGLGVVVGGRGDDRVVGSFEGVARVRGGVEAQVALGEKGLDLGVDDGGHAPAHRFDPLRRQIEGRHVVVLRQEDGVRQADVSDAGDGDLHDGAPLAFSRSRSWQRGTADSRRGRGRGPGRVPPAAQAVAAEGLRPARRARPRGRSSPAITSSS